MINHVDHAVEAAEVGGGDGCGVDHDLKFESGPRKRR